VLDHEEPKRALPDPTIWPTMTVPWAARVLGVAPRTLYDAIDRGEFECIRIRRRILVKTQYLVDLLGTGSSDE